MIGRTNLSQSGYIEGDIIPSCNLEMIKHKELWRKYSDGNNKMTKLTIDEDGNAYTSEHSIDDKTYNITIKKISPNGSIIWTYTYEDYYTEPCVLIVDKDGNLYLPNDEAKKTKKLSSGGKLIHEYDYFVSAVDKDSNLYVIDGYYYEKGRVLVRKISPDGRTVWTHKSNEIKTVVEGENKLTFEDRRKVKQVHYGKDGYLYIQYDKFEDYYYDGDRDKRYVYLYPSVKKLDLSKNTIWEKTFINANAIYDVAINETGQICICYDPDFNRWIPFVFRSNGNSIYEIGIEDSNREIPMCGRISNKGYVYWYKRSSSNYYGGDSKRKENVNPIRIYKLNPQGEVIYQYDNYTSSFITTMEVDENGYLYAVYSDTFLVKIEPEKYKVLDI